MLRRGKKISFICIMLLLVSFILSTSIYAKGPDGEKDYLSVLKTDFHKHLISPDNKALYEQVLPLPAVTTGEDMLNTLPNKKAKCFLLSDGYISSVLFNSGMFKEGDIEYDKVKRSNNWAALQVAQNSDRLIGFGSVDFLKPFAMEEIKRCHEQLEMPGLKLFFPAANGLKGFNWDSKTDVQRINEVFQYASKHEMPILIHHMGNITSNSAIEASNIIELAAKYPKIRLQIAHLGGGSDSNYLNSVIKSLNKYPKLQVYFDISSLVCDDDDELLKGVYPVTPDSDLKIYADAIRSIGIDRILFGSDLPVFSTTEDYMSNIQKLSLTNEELLKIYNKTPEKTLFKGITKKGKIMAPTIEGLAKQGITLESY